jgi:hypothetical protein
MLSLALSAYEHIKKNTRLPSCALKKISKLRAYFSTEREDFPWKEENQERKSRSLKECGENMDFLEFVELESIKN